MNHLLKQLNRNLPKRVFRFLKRKIYNPLIPLLVGNYAKEQLSLGDKNSINKAFPCQVSYYSCPIINPPGQQQVFKNKLHNLSLILSKMQGLIIKPKEVFSFWQLVGEPNVENGFLAASTFINHKVVMTIGGGICQLSGLLYNVALLAGCKILERHQHSIDAYGEGRYIPLGQDATVTYPRKDICFQNPYNYPLLLMLEITPEKASGWLYASQPAAFSVEIIVSSPKVTKSPLIKVVDPLLTKEEIIEKGLDGKTVKAWRIIKINNKTIKKELLSKDTYLSTPTYIRIPGGCVRSGSVIG